MTTQMLRQGDKRPGHVAVLIGIEASGKEVAFQAQNLDRAFLGFFYPTNAYPGWRGVVLPVDEFKQAYLAVEAR